MFEKFLFIQRFHTLIALGVFAISGCAREKDLLDEQVRNLCAKDGGTKVFEQVSLNGTAFEEINRNRLPQEDSIRPNDEFFYRWDVSYYKKGNPSMRRSSWKVVRRSDNKVLGEAISYHRVGGDLPGPWNESSFACPSGVNEIALIMQVFVRSPK